MTARTWTIEDHGSRPLTLNRVADLHRQQWAAHTAAVRGVWHLLARQAKVRRCAAVVIDVTPLHRDNRSPQDTAACAAEAKAAIDGLRDAGLIVDDTGAHVRRVSFYPPEVCGRDGLRLTITEVTD